MTEVADAFKFEHIPRNIDKSSIKVFVNTKGIYSLEYGIVQPQDVFIHMHAVPHGLFRKKKSVERGMAAIHTRLLRCKESVAMALCRTVVALIRTELTFVRRILPVAKGKLHCTTHLRSLEDVRVVDFSSLARDTVPAKELTGIGGTGPHTVPSTSQHSSTMRVTSP